LLAFLLFCEPQITLSRGLCSARFQAGIAPRFSPNFSLNVARGKYGCPP